MLSDCLSPHVDACQIERGPRFIDWVIREVAIEGLVEFQSVWVIPEGGHWVLEQLCVFDMTLSVCKDKYTPCTSIDTGPGMYICSQVNLFSITTAHSALQPLIRLIKMCQHHLFHPGIMIEPSSHLCLTEVPAEMPDSNHGVFLRRISNVSLRSSQSSPTWLENTLKSFTFLVSLFSVWSCYWNHLWKRKAQKD